MASKLNEYTKDVDFKFLKAMDVTVKEYQPWQLGLFHPDLTGKYVWYPKKGTLMYESDEGIANVGEFLASKDTTEDVVNVIMRKVLEQQNS